jgi:hypothetical protein
VLGTTDPVTNQHTTSRIETFFCASAFVGSEPCERLTVGIFRATSLASLVMDQKAWLDRHGIFESYAISGRLVFALSATLN